MPPTTPLQTPKSFHFISGLPRSGSTLLAALLRQNPRFQADMTSGLGALVSGAMQIMSMGTVYGRTEALMGQESLVGRRTILLTDLFKRYQGMEFWRDLNATQAHVITSKPAITANLEGNQAHVLQ